jgi:hypothetical protein
MRIDEFFFLRVFMTLTNVLILYLGSNVDIGDGKIKGGQQ